MLVISRKAGESIVLSGNIRITVTALSSEKVAIGIDAPREIKVVREELMETIEANIAAGEKAGSADYKGIADLLKKNKKIDEK